MALGEIACDLHEAKLRIFERHHQSRCPEARAVFALVPALVYRTSVCEGLRPLLLRRACSLILRDKNDVPAGADKFGFRKTEQPFGADVPGRHQTGRVDGKYPEIRRALDNELE